MKCAPPTSSPSQTTERCVYAIHRLSFIELRSCLPLNAACARASPAPLPYCHVRHSPFVPFAPGPRRINSALHPQGVPRFIVHPHSSMKPAVVISPILPSPKKCRHPKNAQHGNVSCHGFAASYVTLPHPFIRNKASYCNKQSSLSMAIIDRIIVAYVLIVEGAASFAQERRSGLLSTTCLRSFGEGDCGGFALGTAAACASLTVTQKLLHSSNTQPHGCPRRRIPRQFPGDSCSRAREHMPLARTHAPCRPN